MKHICLVVPTYNEGQTISQFLTQAIAVLESIPECAYAILVVDDSSPDGTQVVVKDYQKNHPMIHLLLGKKRGLGKAYMRGFSWVLEHLPQTDYIFEIDADLSHDPAYIKQFLAALNSGVTVVIGSRYIPGGGCNNWSQYRLYISKSANWITRSIGPLRSIHDCTSGYRGIDVSLLKAIDWPSIRTSGYAFQVQFLYTLIQHGARVREIPIIFTERQHGTSKLGPNDIIEAAATVVSLWWQNRRILKR